MGRRNRTRATIGASLFFAFEGKYFRNLRGAPEANSYVGSRIYTWIEKRWFPIGDTYVSQRSAAAPPRTRKLFGHEAVSNSLCTNRPQEKHNNNKNQNRSAAQHLLEPASRTRSGFQLSVSTALRKNFKIDPIDDREGLLLASTDTPRRIQIGSETDFFDPPDPTA